MNIGTQNENRRQDWLKRVLGDLPAGIRLLDAGAGELQNKKHCNHLEYISQDFAMYDGKGDGIGLQTQTWDNSKIDITSDITSIPVDNHSFDAILCSEVLEHLPDPSLVFPEFSRIIKPNGKLIITAPFCSLTHFAPFHFSNGFNKYYYEYHLKKTGFEIEELIPNGNYFDYIAQEILRLPYVAEKYASYNKGFLDRKVLAYVIKALEKMNDTDTGSSELLCFGYHVLARKI